jgi:hypothetical protein
MDLACVGIEHAEHDAHGRRLPCTVGTDEAVHLTRADREGQVIERNDVPVPLGQAVQLEHSTSCLR